MIRALAAILLVLVLVLQYKAWFGVRGHYALEDLRAQVAEQRERTSRLEQGNRLLRGEVLALQQGNTAIEARARQDLGMVREDEIFFVVPEPSR